MVFVRTLCKRLKYPKNGRRSLSYTEAIFGPQLFIADALLRKVAVTITTVEQRHDSPESRFARPYRSEISSAVYLYAFRSIRRVQSLPPLMAENRIIGLYVFSIFCIRFSRVKITGRHALPVTVCTPLPPPEREKTNKRQSSSPGMGRTKRPEGEISSPAFGN